MNIENPEEYFITRHSLKSDKEHPESEEYPGITESGVELAKEKGEKLKQAIDKAPNDAVIFIGGATDIIRTKSTAEVYGEALKDGYKDNPDVLVLTKKDIQEKIEEEKSIKKGVEIIAEMVKNNQDKKVILDYPLFIKELSFNKGWGFWDEKDEGKYFTYLKQKYDNDKDAFVEWIETKGQAKERELKGPIPEEIADNYLKGLRRLRDFVKKQIGERPIIIGAVTHRWDLDTFIIKTIKGEVTMEGFEEIFQGELTNETEGTFLQIKDDNVLISFRGKDYNIKIKDEE